MEQFQILNLHLISDGTGHTVRSLANSVLSRLENINLKRYYWPFIKNQEDFQYCLNKISNKPGLVLYTLKNSQFINQLSALCDSLQIPCISAIDHHLISFKKYFDVGILSENHHKTRLNERYFDKVDAMNFSLKHDDGQSMETIDQADIVIVGASRSSKTPTSMYLAYNGYKTANIPYIPGIPLPKILNKIKDRIIIGLTISPARLIEVRYNRLVDMQSNLNTDYIDLASVSEECKLAKKTFLEHNWPIVDVTHKSIEETAAAIIKLYYFFEAKKNEAK